MLQHHIKLTLRGFRRFKTSFAINLIGLSSGLACALLIYLWVSDEYAMDNFHKDGDRLFQVLQNINIIDKVETIEMTPALLAETLNEELPILDKTVSVLPPGSYGSDGIVEYNGKKLKTLDQYASSEFFEVFSFPLGSGSPSQVLLAKESVVLSEAFAEKLFGKGINPIGESITWEKGGDPSTHIVTGIFEKLPNNTSRPFDVVFTMESFLDSHPHLRDWQNSDPSTFIVLSENASITGVQEQVNRIITAKWEGYRHSFLVQRYADRYLYGKYENGEAVPGRMQYVRLFSIVAGLVLLIACINFMNLSTARASKRAHEVGVRKAIGADRARLIRQYIGEAILISSISLIASYLLVLLFLPQFNIITDKSIQLVFNWELVMISVITVLVTGILAGSYPALYLTHFNPVQVLKGEIKSSMGEIWARKGLVIFQFTITIVLIVGVFIIHKQTQYAFTKNLGYDRDNVVFFSQDGGISDKREAFLTELRNIPGVVNAAATSHSFMHQQNNTMGLEWRGKQEDEKILFENIQADYDLLKTMGFELVVGRWFDKGFGADSTKMLVNEAGAKAMGFTPEEAIGEKVKLWDEYDLEIIGVVKDFHYMSIHNEVDPAFFWLRWTWNIATRIEAGKEVATMNAIEDLYHKFSPGFIFEYEFMDKRYQQLYASEQRVGTLSSYFAGFAILISCLGLFGLAAFTAERRIKEIGIRKVLGATKSNIVMMLSKDFTRLVGVSILIAIPISYFLMKEWLQSFAYKINLSAWIFVGSAVVSLLIAWLTVSSQALRAASVNPAKCLKDE